MSLDDGATPKRTAENDLSRQVGVKEQRKIRGRLHDRSVWFGLGMFGLVGWSIAVPTIIGIAAGLWIDRTWDHEFSCTLMGLFVGIVAGCMIAWYWVKRESLAEMDTETDATSHRSGKPDQGSTRE
jgi:ATP synthase protein I